LRTVKPCGGLSTKHGEKRRDRERLVARRDLRGLPKENALRRQSKGRSDSFTKGLAREVGGEGIRVNGVRPADSHDIHEVHGGYAAARAIGARAAGPRRRAAEIAEPCCGCSRRCFLHSRCDRGRDRWL
jgi:NAD(P)-dependent dehydrogenase (short-subunit alcohol dehydrogenase family)